jgi:hypothetical protein
MKIPALLSAAEDADGYVDFGVPELEEWAHGMLERSLGISLYSIG